MRKCRKELATEDWFCNKWWINLNFDNNGFTFQLSKTHWHNHTGRGIHFEFWIGELEHQTKSLPVVLHFEPDVPERKALGLQFKTAFAELEANFDDYRINHAAICDKLQKQVAFTKSSLPKVIVPEFRRLQVLGPTIDELLTRI